MLQKAEKITHFWKEGAEIDEEGKGNPGKPGKQLKDCGADLLHYQELLDDYIFFFGMERKMQAAVKKQGLTVTAVSAAGKEYDKENPAIKAAALYNQRMLHILREMGLTTATCRPPETDGSGDLG